MSLVLSVRGLSYTLANGRELFKNLNFSLDRRVAALVGPNGVGKTCLAKILVGELASGEGVIRRQGAVALLPQREEPAHVDVAEFLATRYQWSLHGEELLQGIDRLAPCTALSGGQWMRVRLACALGGEFVILDEPTNDLDRSGRDAVLRFLRQCEAGALLISHDRECLELCEDIFELSNRGLARFGGGWSAYVDAQEQERERLSTALELAKRERDRAVAERVERRARQEKRSRHAEASAARGGVPRILLGARKRRAQVTAGTIDVATSKRLEDAVRQAHEAFCEMKLDPVMYAELFARALPAQKLVAEARGFNICFKRWVYGIDLDFTWRGNVRVAVKGANGSGKTTLLKALLGERFETRGELRRGDLVTLYLDQRCGLLDDDSSVFDNIRQVASGSETEIRNGLARFLFAKDAVFQKVGDLSGGERLRAALARGFLSAQKPDLMILDEPTNNLDLRNVRFLEGIVSEFQGALVVVSHDERFLAGCRLTGEISVVPSSV
jgi:ATPase subunit of ABC transporter with duplicated ATPase domains